MCGTTSINAASGSADPVRRRLSRLVSHAAGFADRHLLVLLVLCYVAATVSPTLGRTIRTTPVFSVSIPVLLLALLLFLAGLGIDRSQLRAAATRRWSVLLGQIGLWTVPLSAVSLLWQWPDVFPPGLLPGLGLVALMPAAASSVAWSQLSGGNVALSVGLFATSTLLSPFLISVVGWSGLATADTPLSTRPTATVATLVLWIVPAVAGGVIIRWWAGPARLAAWKPLVKVLSTATLLLLNYANAALALPQVFSDPDWQVLGLVASATLFVCGGGFVTGWLFTGVGNLEPSMQGAFVFGLGMKNTGMALVLAGVWLGTQPLATVAIILYTLTQHVLAAVCHRYILPSSGGKTA